MTSPQHIIINHSGFHPAMRHGMEKLGIIFDQNTWKPTAQQMKPTVACHIWFYECIRHPFKIWRLKRRLSRYNIPLIAWNRDAPHYLNHTKPQRRWILNLANWLRLLDIYATHTLIDEHRTFANLVLFLPNAADSSRYTIGNDPSERLLKLRNSEDYRWDVTFFGGMNGSKYKEDKSREAFFKELGKRLEELNITYCFREADGMSSEDQIHFIQASRINLNFGARCEYGASIASGLPERCYGIPACGGFLLCDKRTHARDDFTPGENWAEYDGLDDCVEKIQYWLAHFDKARDLAERCHTHVLNNHTYAHRAEKLLNAIHAWHAGARGLIK